jgi:hypothetical protein
MFHTGRSGSSVIADMLGQHPAIHWDGELFNYQLMLWRNNPRNRMEEAQVLVRRRMSLFDKPVYGFEILPTQLLAGQIDQRELLAVLDEFGVGHFVVLTRRNILRKIVSNLVARERGRWRLKAGESAPLTRIHIDTDNVQMATTQPLVTHIRETLVDYEALSASLGSRRCLHLVYERDVLPDPRCAYRKICGFLGIDDVELPVRHGQTTPHRLRQIIRNYTDVEQALSGTEFEWMLEEDEDTKNHEV